MHSSGSMMRIRPYSSLTGPPRRIRPVSERLVDLVQALDEAVDLLGDRVEVEARPVRGGDAESGHQRLAAVVSGADRDALPVEDLRDVVRMDALEVEGDDPGAPLRWRPKEAQPGHVGQALERVDGEGVLVLLDCLDA